MAGKEIIWSCVVIFIDDRPGSLKNNRKTKKSYASKWEEKETLAAKLFR